MSSEGGASAGSREASELQFGRLTNLLPRIHPKDMGKVISDQCARLHPALMLGASKD